VSERPDPADRHDVLAARAAAVATSLALEEETPVARARKRASLVAGLLGAAAALLLLVAWRPAFEWLALRWNDDHGYYGHGPLIPLIALGLVWRRRSWLAPAPDAEGRTAGAILLATAVLLQVAAAALRVHFLSGTALLLAVTAACFLLGGSIFTRTLAFPLGFLALALPLPMEWIARVSLELKLLAAGSATHALALLGITAVQEGSAIHLSQGDVLVEDACSGIRSLMALLALGVLIAGFDYSVPWRRRLFLVLLVFPVAIAANAARVALLCGLVQALGPDILESWAHEGSGYLVYALSLGLLLIARALLVETRPPSPPPLVLQPRAPSAASTATLLVAFLPCAVATLALDRKSDVLAPPIATALPVSLGGWESHDLPIEDYVRRILDTNDLISRRYTRPGERPVFVYVAASRGDRKVAHPPEVCAPGNGYLVQDHGEVELSRGVRAVRFTLARGNDRQLIVYFYAAGRWLGPGYIESQLRAAVQRFWSPEVPCALVRLSAPIGPGDSADDVFGSIRRLADELIPALLKRLGEEK
jgi:EpsI family protein